MLYRRRSAQRHRVVSSFISLLKIAFALAELLIVSRIILDFLRASPEAPFVRWIASATDPLLIPFLGTFPALDLGRGFLIETYALLALFVYAIVGYLVSEALSVAAAHHYLWRKGKRSA